MCVRDVLSARDPLSTEQRALGALEERAWLARELHDSLAQALTFIYLAAESARAELSAGRVAAVDASLASLAQTAREAQSDVRRYIAGSRAAAVDGSLAAFLQVFLHRFSESNKLIVDLDLSPAAASLHLEPYAELQTRYIVGEALANACRHGQARHVCVALRLDDHTAELSIRDDGQGFDPVQAVRGPGFGLDCMRERAESIGGTLAVASAPGEGACVTLRVPLDEAA